MCFAGDSPVRTQTQKDVLSKCADLGVGGLVNAHPIVAAAHKSFIAKKRHSAIDRFVNSPMVAPDRCGDTHILFLPLEYQARGAQWRAALPFLDDSGIARFGKRSGTEIGADIKCIAVAP